MIILAGFASTTLLFAAVLVSDLVRYPEYFLPLPKTAGFALARRPKDSSSRASSSASKATSAAATQQESVNSLA